MKMKIKSLLIVVLLLVGVGGVTTPSAGANNDNQYPTVESFTFTPQEIDLTASNTTVSFELVVSHPSGIDTLSTLLTLTSARNDSLSVYLTRTDQNPVITKVTYRGSLSIPRNLNPGVYALTATGVKNNSSAGYQFDTGTIKGPKMRALVGAESELLIRSGGDLNFDYETFIGPTYDSVNPITYKDTVKYNSSVTPLWRVGEKFDPSNYFELRVPTLAMSTSSLTPNVCASDGKVLTFLTTGACSFSISTPKTKDYLQHTYSQTVNIVGARLKPELIIGKIAAQDVKDLGKSIEIFQVYSVSEGYVFPVTLTPAVCYASSFYVKLIAGGTCKLTYQSAANTEFLASDLYTVSFEILKDGQPVVAPTPVVTPTPVATPTAKPVVKKRITCVKGKKTVKKTAVSPKCPKGYKLKK
jgi:hypothetical protein